jgi:hypothetical protein
VRARVRVERKEPMAEKAPKLIDSEMREERIEVEVVNRENKLVS